MERVKKHFGLTGKERGNRQVPCPFHNDSNASASLNWKKGVLHCFTCNKGWPLTRVEEHLTAQEEPQEVFTPTEPLAISEEELLTIGGQLLEDRGVADAVEAAPFHEVSVDTNPESPLWGYLVFDLGDGREVARYLLESDKAHPRYRNSSGHKGLTWVTADDGASPVWLTEGIFDALSLAAVGVAPVAAVLGSSMSDAQRYELRGRTAYLAFDNDVAGFRGAKEEEKALLEFGATPIILPPPEQAKDLNELLVADRDALEAWVVRQRSEFGKTDAAFLERSFQDPEDVLVVPTGLGGYDELLGGGYKAGVHTLGAEPGIGKTSFALRFGKLAAESGLRVLYITYEISKRQCWARLLSAYDELPWNHLEMVLHEASPAAQKRAMALSQRLRVAAGWNVNKIKHAAPDYDVIIVDYLQRMPGPFGENENKANIDYNVSRLSDLARDSNKVILVVSSLPRSDYGSKMTKKSFKESGGIEYMSQSLTGLIAQRGGTILGTVVKNTRGREGTFWLKSDLGHIHFEWAKPPGEKQ